MMQSESDLATSWYLPEAGTDLGQGDQLFDFPLLYVARDERGKPVAFETSTDLIILTQSCDLAHGKVSMILTAVVTSVSDWIVENPYDLERLEAIRQGFDASLYLLPGWPDGSYTHVRHDRMVDFGTVYSVTAEDIARTLSSSG